MRTRSVTTAMRRATTIRRCCEQRYDCIVSQDVIEHVDDPQALLALFDRMAEPGAIISIGTPDAAALDLRDTDNFVHALHLPYHRHILSAAALQQAGQDARLGALALLRHDVQQHAVSDDEPALRAALHALPRRRVRSGGRAVRASSWKLLSPLTPFFAFFGFFFDRHTDVQAVFRKPARGGATHP